MLTVNWDRLKDLAMGERVMLRDRPVKQARYVNWEAATGHYWGFQTRPNAYRVNLHIDFGGDEPRAEAAFQALKAHRSEIEAAFGDRLEWEPDPEGRHLNRTGRCIASDLPQSGLRTPEWRMVEALGRLQAALERFL
jgi:hypothetical protein